MTLKRLERRLRFMINVNAKLARAIQELNPSLSEIPSTGQPVTETSAPNETNNPNKINWEALKPFPRIPNCRNFKIELGGIDKVFQFFKINKKIPPKLEFEGHTNQKFINYYARQIERLKRERDNPKAYWKRVRFLLGHS